MKKEALAVSLDPDHKFELALQLSDLDMAMSLAEECGGRSKWLSVATLAMTLARFAIEQVN